MSDEIQTISAQTFWGAFFAGTPQELRRDRSGMRGVLAPRPHLRTPSPLDLLKPGQPFFAPREALAAYDYVADKRFLRIVQRPETLGDVLKACVAGTYPWRYTPPLSQPELSAECAALLKAQDPERLRGVDLSTLVDEADTALSGVVLGMDFALAARLWLFGEFRFLPAVPTILRAIQMAGSSESEADILGESVFGTALNAFFQCNDKRYLSALVEGMARMHENGKVRIRNLLVAMLSTDVAAGLPTFPDVTPEQARDPEFWNNLPSDLEPGYWLGRLPVIRPALEEWAVFDAGAMHWELRWLAAQRLPSGHPALADLRADEVAPVASAATSRAGR